MSDKTEIKADNKAEEFDEEQYLREFYLDSDTEAVFGTLTLYPRKWGIKMDIDDMTMYEQEYYLLRAFRRVRNTFKHYMVALELTKKLCLHLHFWGVLEKTDVLKVKEKLSKQDMIGRIDYQKCKYIGKTFKYLIKDQKETEEYFKDDDHFVAVYCRYDDISQDNDDEIIKVRKVVGSISTRVKELKKLKKQDDESESKKKIKTVSF